ncbi:MAG: hypothetical protein P8P82_03535 [Flavobacteriales bacterium]|jgi:hypothetical protein|nr:hypothetical protein [Flavobacteriales bacterium]MDG1426462.1 hypothetical protein [Flavobacteriales bacterium]MDG2085991.1 hypothetical protein [Flavobacteriales bacterium]|tara:strand:+ start:327 stop:878 length:552 start_codon:yes stop_codon:yes gene_type:complete
MQFIEDIKKKVGKWVFKRELKINKRRKEVCNLESAKSIGILYDASSEEQINLVRPFVSFFFDLKKDVKALGFVNAKELSYCHVPKLQYDFFYKKDLNWYYKPQNYIIDNFIKKEHDILINLTDSSVIPIKYLVASSLAHFKIGIYEENYEIYDLMISLTDDRSQQKLMNEIKHYINLINKKNG